MDGLQNHKAAAREAFEEAGIVGDVEKTPIGCYQYWKRLADGFSLCEVAVYALRVEQQARKWLERGQRESRWCSAMAAIGLVEEPGLQDLIRQFAADRRPAAALLPETTPKRRSSR